MDNILQDIIKTAYPEDDSTKTITSLVVNDREGNILICDAFFSLITGIPIEKLLNMKISDLIKNKVYEKSTILKAIETKQVISEEFSIKQNIRVHSVSTPVLDSMGEISMVVTVSHPLKYDEYTVEEIEKLQKITEAEYNMLKKVKIFNDRVVAESLSMKRILHTCNQIANFDSKVYLYGESGTGKEVLANYIHQISNRKDAHFVTVNCAAIPDNLFESELFGHEKGSFTGANVTKQGLFEIADGGTLFLDEISEMNLELQAKLLRVLETNEVRRIGGTETKKVDFRLITASNTDLKKMVEKGKFRKDLYYRIHVIPIVIPPLRERIQDIVALTNKFINELNQRYHLNYQIDSEHLCYITKHNWPGNVRELKNYIERIVVTNEGNVSMETENYLENNCFISFKHDTDLKSFLAEAERQYILKVLADCNDKMNEASKKLGIHRTALYRKLKSYKEEEE